MGLTSVGRVLRRTAPRHGASGALPQHLAAPRGSRLQARTGASRPRSSAG